MKDRRSERRGSGRMSQFSNMLKIGREAGCQIQPSAANPNILNGLCPFHGARTLHEAKSLHIDLHTGRFWCSTCPASGTPLAFIARTWGISAQETYQFIQSGCEITPDRPRWETQPQLWEQGPPQAQNTAILTLATRYYTQQVERNYHALSYLTRLGITPGKPSPKGSDTAPGRDCASTWKGTMPPGKKSTPHLCSNREPDWSTSVDARCCQTGTGPERPSGCWHWPRRKPRAVGGDGPPDGPGSGASWAGGTVCSTWSASTTKPL